MRVRVRYFAALREAAGREAETLDLPEGATVAAVRSAVADHSPAVARVLAACSVAVNRGYATPETVLAEGDEVAFLPPVGGG